MNKEDDTNRRAPSIKDKTADAQFRQLGSQLSLPPNGPWLTYVNEGWTRGRHILEMQNINGKAVLEFGCNVGATAIVLATLGATVVAIDINPGYVELARLNAQRYGVADRIRFIHVTDTTKLPFDDASFEFVTCMSVLEYIAPETLSLVQKEIDRVLCPGGVIFISSTSNRLWPREVHSGRWCVNYLPRRIDVLLSKKGQFQRGVFPGQISRGFGEYENLDLKDRGKKYLEAKAKMGLPPFRMLALQTANYILQSFGTSLGLYMPSITARLTKPIPRTTNVPDLFRNYSDCCR